ncbi:hypothetical protein WG904_05720 [Pedobacter sp. Du54]|uniref:hypothetical protein n=1 Tax=Pedobacter anseongensis TaxID=3133439 RepID=UPI0030A4F973
MNNKLEGFIKENKKAFEAKGPSDKLWSRIEAELDKKNKKKAIKFYRWLSVAALLVMSIGVYNTYTKMHSEIEVADISADYGKKEVHFAGLIEEKRDSLALYSKENPDLFKKFVGDLKKLDENYQDLKKELQTSPDPDAVVSEMIKNLAIQADILSQQLSIINQVNQYKKENTI